MKPTESKIRPQEKPEDDYLKKNQDQKTVHRCGQCRRQRFGHEGNFGLGSCTMEPLDDKDLEEDDKKKNEMRNEKEKRNKAEMIKREMESMTRGTWRSMDMLRNRTAAGIVLMNCL